MPYALLANMSRSQRRLLYNECILGKGKVSRVYAIFRCIKLALGCTKFSFSNLMTYVVIYKFQAQPQQHHHLLLNTLKGHTDAINGFCFTSNGRGLATGIIHF